MTDKKVETLPAKQEERTTMDQVLAKIRLFEETGELKIPKDYAMENNIRAAWLILQEVKDSDKNFVLQSCSKESIANALLKMVIMGLSPLKKQCDFIAYGKQLTCQPEYTGNIALAKRFGGLKWIKGNAVFEGDEFEFQVDATTGRKKVLSHKQDLESFGSLNILGAYAIYELNDGTTDVEIMNIKQILSAWQQGTMKGNSPAHKNFPDQMAIKTVINRACKLLIRSSDDSVLLEDDDEMGDTVKENVKQKISDNANKETIGFNKVKREVKPTVQQTEEVTEYENVSETAGENNISQPEEQPGPGY